MSAPLPGPGADDERVARGVEHLQVAATELIAAARAFLDVAEDVVADPERLSGLAETFGDLARGVQRAAGAAGRDDRRDPGVERIHVG